MKSLLIQNLNQTEKYDFDLCRKGMYKMSNFVKFGSIDQLRHFVKDMKHHGKEVVNLTGTVKIHGTNAGIGYDCTDKRTVCAITK